jgi:hypothetical protein
MERIEQVLVSIIASFLPDQDILSFSSTDR